MKKKRFSYCRVFLCSGISKHFELFLTDFFNVGRLVVLKCLCRYRFLRSDFRQVILSIDSLNQLLNHFVQKYRFLTNASCMEVMQFLGCWILSGLLIFVAKQGPNTAAQYSILYRSLIVLAIYLLFSCILAGNITDSFLGSLILSLLFSYVGNMWVMHFRSSEIYSRMHASF